MQAHDHDQRSSGDYGKEGRQGEKPGKDESREIECSAPAPESQETASMNAMKLPLFIFDGYKVTDQFCLISTVLGVLFLMLPWILAIWLEKGQWYSR